MPAPPPGAARTTPTILRAGPLTLTYLDGEIRDIRLGRYEVVRRVYLVFQDRNWTARPWLVGNESIQDNGDSFTATFDARGTFDAAGFAWTGSLTGDADGVVTFDVEGTAGSDFERNRLGLCVLHPVDETAGRTCLVESTAGEIVESTFPDDISPTQPFLDVRAITHEVSPGAWASVRMIGETFETEDHRNWSDASFKTYATPISLPFPALVRAGSTLEQSVILAVDIGELVVEPPPTQVIITVDTDAAAKPLPRLGLQVASDGAGLTDSEIARLRTLHLDHVRVDVHAVDPGAGERLSDAAAQARAIGSRLVVALFATGAEEIRTVVERATEFTDVIECWLVFDPGQKVTGAERIAEARAALGPAVRIGGGTNLYFTEVNREPPDLSGLDVVSFSLNPQVHASDSTTLVQNLAAQGMIAAQAPRLCGTASIHVGPITLRPRFNPNATAPELDVSSTELPSSVDRRQAMPFGALWTVISLKYLAEAGTVDAITYFETTGWRGVMERAEGSPQPDDFPSTAGEPFPVLEALAALVGFTHVRPCRSNLPQQVDALLLERGGDQRLLVANFTDRPQDVRVEGLGAGTPATLHIDPQEIEILDLRKARS